MSIKSIKLKLQHIIEILERMEKNQEDFFARMEATLSCPPAGKEIWIDGLEVQNLLGMMAPSSHGVWADAITSPNRPYSTSGTAF